MAMLALAQLQRSQLQHSRHSSHSQLQQLRELNGPYQCPLKSSGVLDGRLSCLIKQKGCLFQGHRLRAVAFSNQPVRSFVSRPSRGSEARLASPCLRMCRGQSIIWRWQSTESCHTSRRGWCQVQSQVTSQSPTHRYRHGPGCLTWSMSDRQRQLRVWLWLSYCYCSGAFIALYNGWLLPWECVSLYCIAAM